MPSLRSERNKNAYKQINQLIINYEAKLQNKESSQTRNMLEKVDSSFFHDPNIKNADVILEKKVSAKSKEPVSKVKTSKKIINWKKITLLISLFLCLILIIVLLMLEG